MARFNVKTLCTQIQLVVQTLFEYYTYIWWNWVEDSLRIDALLITIILQIRNFNLLNIHFKFYGFEETKFPSWRLKSRKNFDPSYYFCAIKFYIKRLLHYLVLWKKSYCYRVFHFLEWKLSCNVLILIIYLSWYRCDKTLTRKNNSEFLFYAFKLKKKNN